jgi:flagellar basal body-associated protein FliL
VADDEELLDEEEEEEYNIPAIIGAAVILILIIVAIWYFLFREKPEVPEEDAGPVWEKPVDQEAELVFDLLPKLIINPLGSRGRHMLIVKVDVVYRDRDVLKQQISKPWRIPQVQNMIIDTFSSYTLAQLRDSLVKEECRKLIQEDLNRLLGWDGPPELILEADDAVPPVKDVYFTEYILH